MGYGGGWGWDYAECCAAIRSVPVAMIPCRCRIVLTILLTIDRIERTSYTTLQQVKPDILDYWQCMRSDGFISAYDYT